MKNKLIVIGFLFVLLVVFFIYDKQSSNNTEKKIVYNDHVEIYNVYLDGEVKQKGYYEVLSNTTLEDFLNDKLTSNSDVNNYNLNDKVINNYHYHIGYMERININEATKDELMTLEGIGEVRSNTIIEFRNNNPFTNIYDLVTNKIVTEAIYEKIKNRITI